MRILKASTVPVQKDQWDQDVPVLREALLDAQHDLRMAGTFGTIVLLTGVRTAGKSETVHRLTEWMDPRSVNVHALSARTEEERLRPRMWRYWRRLPPKGRIGIFYGGWYNPIFSAVVLKGRPLADLDHRLDQLRRFERLLTDEGLLLIKLHLQISKADQKRRIEQLHGKKKTRWRLTREDWLSLEHHDQMTACFEDVLQATDRPAAGWTILDAQDERFRELTAARTVVADLRERLDAQPHTAAEPSDNNTVQAELKEPLRDDGALATLDLSQTLDDQDYDGLLEQARSRLALMTRRKAFRHRGVIVVFEGIDAAGKGGSIRRVTSALDARLYTVIPIGAPTDEERAKPWLWRFWRHVPELGRMTIFDRSWYGRVLVERIEGFCSEADWRRAYDEIVEFENELSEHGLIVVKFFLVISKAEQLRRFEARQDTSYKRIKLTEEDWRNRARFSEYEVAIQQMVERTSTRAAPWTLIAADDKRFARVQILKTLAHQLKVRMKTSPE